jgi:hypothetical protein
MAMFASLKKRTGLGLSGNEGVRRAERPRTRPELEALDQRLLPSSVPNLGGVAMHFDVYPGNNTLAITSVQDQGGGKGTFVALYDDSRDGVVTAVSGTIALKGMAPNPWNWPGPGGGAWYDFGVAFSGSAAHFQFNPRTGIWSDTVDRASGSGDFYTNAVSGNAGIYQQGGVGALPTGSWVYSGTESDSLTIYNNYGSAVLGSEYGQVWAENWIPYQLE